jgi:hypothetical protein
MDLNSDLTLHHPLWEKADLELCNNNELGIFNRLIDVYVIACAIGIKEDKVITEIESPLSSPKTIGRNTHRENEYLRNILDFMLQNAIIHSAHIDYDIDERLKLAFNPDYTVKKFSPANFLNGFANYGIEQIFQHLVTKSSLVAVSELYTYFESITESKYEDILKNITLEDILN